MTREEIFLATKRNSCVFLIKTHRTAPTRNFFRRKISEISNVSRQKEYNTKQRQTINLQPLELFFAWRKRKREEAGRKKGRGEREKERIKRLVLFLRTTFGCTDGPRTNKAFLNFDGVPLLQMSYICLGVLKFSIHAENEKWFPRFDPRLSDN